MKKMLLFLALCAPVWGWGQVVDGKRIDQDTTIRYMKVGVIDAGKFGKELYRIAVDYGQPRGGNQRFTILDEKGEVRTWVSDMEVANYFAGYGWRLMYQERLQTVAGSVIVADYLFFERSSPVK